MQFRVLAIDAQAAECRLLLDAPDLAAARQSAAGRGLAVLEIVPMAAGVPWRGGSAARGFALDLFCQELLAMVQAGITVREALHTLADKEALGGGARVIGGLLTTVEEGLPLSAAMLAQPSVFPVLLTESVRAAERTSDYAPALQRFVDYRRLAQQMHGKLVAAALYPMILLGVSVLVLLFLVGFVVPRFAQVYEDMGDRMPAASRVLMLLGQGLTAHPLFSLAVAAALALACVVAWRHGAGRLLLRGLAAAVPRIRELLTTAEMARLYRTLALLLSGGMPLVASLEMAAGVLPPATATRLKAARQRVSEGQQFADSLAAQGLTTLVAERFFRVGERTGRLAEMIDRAAEFHEEEVARAADWVGRVIGPLMMLVMGVVIGLVVVLMYMPIFQLTEMVQ
jgi:general secretion pathway protein F